MEPIRNHTASDLPLSYIRHGSLVSKMDVSDSQGCGQK